MMDSRDIREELHSLYEALEKQSAVLHEQADIMQIDVWEMRLSDGSWPMLQLLEAKAKVLTAMSNMRPNVVNPSSPSSQKRTW